MSSIRTLKANPFGGMPVFLKNKEMQEETRKPASERFMSTRTLGVTKKDFDRKNSLGSCRTFCSFTSNIVDEEDGKPTSTAPASRGLVRSGGQSDNNTPTQARRHTTSASIRTVNASMRNLGEGVNTATTTNPKRSSLSTMSTALVAMSMRDLEIDKPNTTSPKKVSAVSPWADKKIVGGGVALPTDIKSDSMFAKMQQRNGMKSTKW